MTLRDLVAHSAGNLWRVKFRAILTITGVLIAIATFFAMLSFGVGNQKHITRAFQEFGLFTSMKVYPENRRDTDTAKVVSLDSEALGRLRDIPGVVMAYPFVSFDVIAAVADTEFTSQARVLPPEATETRLFARILGGHDFSSDTASEAIVTHKFLGELGQAEPDSLIGKELVVSTRVFSLDSALINVIDDKQQPIRERLKAIRFDSLFNADYRARIMHQELNDGIKRFINGLMERQVTISDTLVIIGVGDKLSGFNIGVAPIIIPEKTARRLSAGGFGVGSNPTDLIAAMRGGQFFGSAGDDANRYYPQVTLELDPYAAPQKVKDSVEALGFRGFSYALEFKEIQRFFLYYNLTLAIIGLLALVTASLGIINTMLMSILERRREIGVIKSLGADERDIKRLFLVESGVIGAVGAVLGIALGWVGTRVVTLVIQEIMKREEMPVFDPFAFPLWLILLSFAFGLAVSLLAGYYPSARAARVDPVEALRAE